jgi:excisionase family DNA binding protein
MELLRVPDVAWRLQLGRSTVYLLIQRGALPCARFGVAVRVPAEALDDCLRRQGYGDVVRAA